MHEAVPPSQQLGRFPCCGMKESDFLLERSFSSPRVEDGPGIRGWILVAQDQESGRDRSETRSKTWL